MSEQLDVAAIEARLAAALKIHGALPGIRARGPWRRQATNVVVDLTDGISTWSGVLVALTFGDEPDAVNRASFVAHAPTDLRLLLDVLTHSEYLCDKVRAERDAAERERDQLLAANRRLADACERVLAERDAANARAEAAETAAREAAILLTDASLKAGISEGRLLALRLVACAACGGAPDALHDLETVLAKLDCERGGSL